jgi:hypothetical protein
MFRRYYLATFREVTPKFLQISNDAEIYRSYVKEVHINYRLVKFFGITQAFNFVITYGTKNVTDCSCPRCPIL